MPTKKVKSAGRFGPRYGKKIRLGIARVEALSRAKYRCPNCMSPNKLKRTAAGIWECKKCGVKVAGGAYSPETGAKKTIVKMIKRSLVKEEAKSEA